MKVWKPEPLLIMVSLMIVTGTVLAGCGQQNASVGGTPVSESSPSGEAFPDPLETEVGQSGVGPVPTGDSPMILPGAQLTREGIIAIETSVQATQVAYAHTWVDRLELNANDPQAEAALKRWQNALRGLKSISGSQVFMQVEPDGTRHARSDDGDLYWSGQGTVERYGGINLGGEGIRYYVALHTSRGDLITSTDGKDAYRTWSWMKNDVFRPLPDRSAKNAYWTDDTGDVAFLHMLRPTPAVYSFVGRREVDGRPMVELVVKSGNYSSGGMTGTHLFLDEQTNLPYRFVIYPRGEGSEKRPAFERTFTNTQINPPLTDADFRPPLGPDTWFVYEPVNPGWTGYKLPVYGTAAEAEKEAGTQLFAPGGRVSGDLAVWGYVEKDSGRKAVISIENGTITILQGVHLPQVTDGGYRFSLRGSSRLGEYETAKVDVNGISAEVWTEPGGNKVRLRMEREGTQIEISAPNKEKAMEVAQRLQPVE